MEQPDRAGASSRKERSKVNLLRRCDNMTILQFVYMIYNFHNCGVMGSQDDGNSLLHKLSENPDYR
ncbi:hypothetical protein D3C71_2233780 [compost metagenome]